MRNGRWLVWLKAIGGALVAVLLVKTLFVTSCFIPSSGMENSLYQGEGVLVGKWSYGLRLPFPSLLGYHRLGASPVERGDIVLFNNPNPADSETGIEWREVFISRCVGLPGDTLSLNRALTVTGNQALSPDSKALYVYPSSSEDLMQAVLETLGLLPGNTLVSYTSDGGYVRSFSHYEFYLVSQKLEGRIPVVPLDSRISQETHPFVVPRKQVPVKFIPGMLCFSAIPLYVMSISRPVCRETHFMWKAVRWENIPSARTITGWLPTIRSIFPILVCLALCPKIT